VRFSILRDVPAAFSHGEELKVAGNPGRILRLLLLARSQLVTKNDLALELGGIRPTSVESVVSRLRTAIRDTDHTIIISTDVDGRGGYRIDQSVAEVDAFMFEEVANDPAVAGAVSFDATDNEFGQMAAGLMDTWRTWHANPAPEVTILDFAEQAYHDFAYMYDRLGHAVAYVPASTAAQFLIAGLAVVPVSDLSPSQVMVAWPDTSRSPAVAAFVRTALEVASRQTNSPNGWAHAAQTPGAL